MDLENDMDIVWFFSFQDIREDFIKKQCPNVDFLEPM